jgi:hypothetical protein
MKLKVSFFATLISLIALCAPSQAQQVDGFVQVGFSQGYSILGAIQVSFNLIQDLTYGARAELLFADGNKDPIDNPKLELQPFISFDTKIASGQDYYLSGGVTLRGFLRGFSQITNNTLGFGYDLALRVQPAINGSIGVAPGWRAGAGTGFGIQLGLLPTQGISYSFTYLYANVRGDLSSLTPNLTVILGGSTGNSFDSNFNPSPFGFGGFAALEYGLGKGLALRFETGYTSGRSYGSYDNPEANGFYVFLRGSFRL